MADQKNRLGGAMRAADARPSGEPSGPVLGRDIPVSDHLPFGGDGQDVPSRSRRLRYQVVYSIDMPEGMANSIGWTDDLAFACWSAERVGEPHALVYDHKTGRWCGDPGPSEHDEAWFAVDRLYKELTEPWLHSRPGVPDEPTTRQHWEAEYPLWRPAPEPILAPLRVALYTARASARSASEAENRAYGSRQLASCPDGRDLEDGYYRTLVYDSPNSRARVTQDRVARDDVQRMARVAISQTEMPTGSFLTELAYCTWGGEPLP